MKRISLFLSILISLPAYSLNCESIGDLAQISMMNRQEGVPLSEMLLVTDDEVAHSVIMIAYERPRFHSDTLKASEVQSFRNKFELACYKRKRKQEE